MSTRVSFIVRARVEKGPCRLQGFPWRRRKITLKTRGVNQHVVGMSRLVRNVSVLNSLEIPFL